MMTASSLWPINIKRQLTGSYDTEVMTQEVMTQKAELHRLSDCYRSHQKSLVRLLMVLSMSFKAFNDLDGEAH